jgi:hypothetical protein
MEKKKTVKTVSAAGLAGIVGLTLGAVGVPKDMPKAMDFVSSPAVVYTIPIRSAHEVKVGDLVVSALIINGAIVSLDLCKATAKADAKVKLEVIKKK